MLMIPTVIDVMIRHWKIKTNLVHDPIAIVNRLDETIIDLTNIDWTKQTMDIAHLFIEAHNLCIDKLNSKAFPEKGKEIKTTLKSNKACMNIECNNNTYKNSMYCIDHQEPTYQPSTEHTYD